VPSLAQWPLPHPRVVDRLAASAEHRGLGLEHRSGVQAFVIPSRGSDEVLNRGRIGHGGVARAKQIAVDNHLTAAFTERHAPGADALVLIGQDQDWPGPAGDLRDDLGQVSEGSAGLSTTTRCG
jgi:hypothetical protein